MIRILVFTVLLVMLGWLGGCASRSEIVSFQVDMAELKSGIAEISAGQNAQDSLLIGRVEFLKERLRETEVVLRRLKADQLQGTEDLRGMLEELRLTLEDAGDYNRRLQQKMDELNLILARQGLRQERDSLAAEDPAWLYNQANLDRMRGMPELARAGFREYLSRFPDGQMQGWCRYWIADTWLSEQLLDSAYQEYQRFEELNPAHDRWLSSRLRRARILAASGHEEGARLLLEEVLRDHGDSPEAALAREQLRELGTP